MGRICFLNSRHDEKLLIWYNNNGKNTLSTNSGCSDIKGKSIGGLKIMPVITKKNDMG